MRHDTITRRSFVRSASLGATALACHGLWPTLASAAGPGPEHGNPLEQFDYHQVQFGSCLQQSQMEETHGVLMGLSEDSLLRPFRVREGLPAPGKDMGGWYDTYAFAPAHAYGQWLSALSRYYAITADPATQGKIDRMVRGYAATIDPKGKFFNENRFPAYIYDKLICGLEDAYQFAHHPLALETMTRLTDAVLSHLPGKAMPHWETEIRNREDFTQHAWDESYTIPENQFIAWQRTGNERYLKMAKQYLFDKEYFDPLSRGENVLPGRHAYSHVNSLSSAAKAYLVLGEEKYFRAARNGFDMVEQQSFATGGWGPDEHFVPPKGGGLGDSLKTTHSSFETPCGSYAHFKLTRYLLRITKDAHYGDSMERVMYNTVLGAKALQPDGRAFYYSDYNFEGHKSFHPDKWPCCSGTLPQIATDYRISTYFRDEQGVYVNLYIPSALRWKQNGVDLGLTQSGNYPFDSVISLQVEAARPTNFTLRLRIPAWITGAASLSVNGKRVSTAPQAASFAVIQRTWSAGDRVDLELPQSIQLKAIDAQHPNAVAVISGPLVLFAISDGPLHVTRKQLLAARRVAGSAAEWQVHLDNTVLRLRPFTEIRDERYTTYLVVS